MTSRKGKPRRKAGPGYQGRGPVRVSVYIFPAQLEIMERIARERGVSKRDVFFECFGLYVGTHLQHERRRSHG